MNRKNIIVTLLLLLPTLVAASNDHDVRWLRNCPEPSEYVLCDMRNGRGYLKKEMRTKGVPLNYGEGFVDYVVGGTTVSVEYPIWGMVPLLRGASIGYVHLSTSQIIFPQFSEVKEFRNGFARVGIGGNINLRMSPSPFVLPFLKDVKYAYIDTNGKKITEHIFGDGGDFEEGLAAVEIEGKWGYIDTKGKIVIPPAFDDARRFSEGLAAVAKVEPDGSRKWGYISREGRVVIPFQFDRAYDFSSERAAVSASYKSGTSGVIDTKGRVVVIPKYQYMVGTTGASLKFNGHPLAARCEIDSSTGCVLINAEGTVVRENIYADVIYYPYHNGLLIVKNGKELVAKSTLFDFQGNVVLAGHTMFWRNFMGNHNSILYVEDENQTPYYLDLKDRVVYVGSRSNEFDTKALAPSEYPQWIYPILTASKRWEEEKAKYKMESRAKNPSLDRGAKSNRKLSL